MRDFESYLMDYWAKNVNVGEDTVLDDDMPDELNNWLEDVDVDMIITLADCYASLRHVEGYKECSKDNKELWDRITSKEGFK